jgi:exopolysaccharide biosynthesis protein
MRNFRSYWIAVGWFCLFVVCQAESQETSPTIVLQAGELRLDGRVRAVDTTKNRFVIEAVSFTNYRGRSGAILPGKLKTISIALNVHWTGTSTSRTFTLSKLKAGMPLAVIGTDLGAGQNLVARAIILKGAGRVLPKNKPQQPAPIHQAPSAHQAPSIRSAPFRTKINGRTYSGTLVRVNLDTVRMKVGLGHNRVGSTESLASMARRHGAVAAINGSYFQAYNSGAYKPPVMTLITGGRAVFTGNIGTTLGFTAENEVRMDRATVVLEALRGGSSRSGQSDPNFESAMVFWPRVREAVGCGPRLVADGRIALNMRGEKFSDPKVLFYSTSRSAVGVTRDRQLLLVTTSGTIPQLAAIMKSLGAYQAMNLDGGASSGLWLRGRYLRSPGRALSNCLLVLSR